MFQPLYLLIMKADSKVIVDPIMEDTYGMNNAGLDMVFMIEHLELCICGELGMLYKINILYEKKQRRKLHGKHTRK